MTRRAPRSKPRTRAKKGPRLHIVELAAVERREVEVRVQSQRAGPREGNRDLGPVRLPTIQSADGEPLAGQIGVAQVGEVVQGIGARGDQGFGRRREHPVALEESHIEIRSAVGLGRRTDGDAVEDPHLPQSKSGLPHGSQRQDIALCGEDLSASDPVEGMHQTGYLDARDLGLAQGVPLREGLVLVAREVEGRGQEVASVRVVSQAQGVAELAGRIVVLLLEEEEAAALDSRLGSRAVPGDGGVEVPGGVDEPSFAALGHPPRDEVVVGLRRVARKEQGRGEKEGRHRWAGLGRTRSVQ